MIKRWERNEITDPVLLHVEECVFVRVQENELVLAHFDVRTNVQVLCVKVAAAVRELVLGLLKEFSCKAG